MFKPAFTTLSLMLFSQLASAAAVVKVRSYPCGDLSLVKTGTGTLLAETPAGKAVLTSSHIVYHGTVKQGICTEVLGEDLKWYSAELTNLQTAMGLALVKPSDDYLKKYPEALNWSQSSEETLTNVVVMGFPLASTNPISQHGQVIQTNSHRIFLPLVNHVIEVQNAHSEYGMSGGALLDGSSNYVGVLSHQYLRVTAGTKAQAEILGPNSKDDDATLIALVIPKSVIHNWFTNIQTSNLTEDIAGQKLGVVRLTFGSLRFSEVACSSSGGIGGEGVGIGGEGVGIGGEGVGIGGGSSNTKPICQISVERVTADQASSQTWPFERSKSWFGHLQDRIAFGQPQIFGKLYFREQQADPRGLYHALTLMQSGYLPLVVPIDPKQNSDVSPDILAKVAALKESLNRLTLPPQSAGAPPEAQRIVDYLNFVAEAIATKNYGLIDTAYTRRVIDGDDHGLFVSGWIYFFNQNFADSVQIVKLTTILCETVDRVKD